MIFFPSAVKPKSQNIYRNLASLQAKHPHSKYQPSGKYEASLLNKRPTLPVLIRTPILAGKLNSPFKRPALSEGVISATRSQCSAHFFEVV